MSKALAYRPPEVEVPDRGAVLQDVTVVNPGAGRLAGRTLAVEGDCVARISPAEPVEGGAYAGCYVLPGLADMHVHVPPHTRDLVNLLFLAHGVTAIREVGDADGTTWRARERIDAGEAPGPRIFTCGPVLDGDPPFLPTSWAVRDAAAAREAVAALAERGADFVKVHHKLSPQALEGIVRAAAEAGLRVVGHVPTSVPFAEAGVWDVQHLDGLVPYPGPGETPLDYQRKWQRLTAAQIEEYARVSADRGRVHTPTLITSYALARMADPREPDDPAARLLPRHYRDGIWSRESVPVFNAFPDEALGLMKESAERRLEVVYRLARAHVRLHLGTDTAGVPFVVPGVSLHQELRRFLEAGLSLEEAWIAGTRAPGESLGVPGLGTAAPGAPADLLIFAADPTRDADALGTLRAVVSQGRLYPKAYLNEALARHRERFEAPLYDALSTALIRLGGRLMTTG
jgi:imidazolonepropionase-like amidohydrolase